MRNNNCQGASKLATLVLCLVCLIALVGCHKDKDNIFTATTQNYNTSKVHISDNYAYWDDGDNVMINGSTYPVAIETSNNNNTAHIAATSVSAINGMYYAAFPAARATMSGSTVTFDVPYNEDYSTNTSGQQLVNNMMVAKSSGEHLHFENVGAMLHFKIKGSGSGEGKQLLAIEVSADVPLSGTLSVDMSGTTAVSFSDNATDTARILTFETPYTLTSTAKDFYLNIPAISGATKFRLRYIINNSGTLRMYDKTKTGNITIEQNSIYHFGEDEYTGSNVKFAGSEGTSISPGSAGKPFRITSGEMFTAASSWLIQANKEFQLDNDITVGTRTTTLKATLDGNGHSITLTNNISLFETIDGGKVRNLTVTGDIISPTCSNFKYGAIACLASNNAEIDNCVNKANISCIQDNPGNNSTIVGGICAQISVCTITNCRNEGTITSNARYTGGVVGYCSGALSVNGCSNSNNINVSFVSTNNTSDRIFVGGLFGQLTISSNSGTHKATNCQNNGSINISGSGSNTLLCGGCFGLLLSSAEYSMENCHNTGDITYNTAAVGECYFGGLVGCDGENASSTMINCYNEGSISTNSGVYAGGLLGRNNWMDIRNCYAICFIDAQTSAGLVGDGLRMRAITQITNCYYYGTMDATNTNYGIAGQSNIYNTNYRMELDHCYYPNDINSICGLVTYAASSCATMSSATDASTLSALNNNIPSGGKSWVIRDGHIVFQ